MARTIRNAKIDTRSARVKLKERREPYWTVINAGCAVGYRRGKSGGTWIARHYSPSRATAMKYKALGPADDAMDADGVAALSYAQAQSAAQAWCASEARMAEGLEPAHVGPYTVKQAMSDYMDHYEREGKAIGATQHAVNAHILPALGDIEIGKLHTHRIMEWHQSLAEAPARLRTAARSGQQKFSAAPVDADSKRARKATANRVLTILKASLNHAWRKGKVANDAAWRKVRPFKNVDAPVIRYLTEDECLRLTNACTADFRPMVKAALLTGCRYGELVALTVSDFNGDNATVAIRTSKSGKPRHVVLSDEGRAFFEDLTTGKMAAEGIFKRSDGSPWGVSHQKRPLAAACKAAKISPAVSFHILRHTHGSLLATRGVPMPVIAQQLGHADTRMTEKHYAHLSPNYVADTIRSSFPNLGLVDTSNVSKLERRFPATNKLSTGNKVPS